MWLQKQMVLPAVARGCHLITAAVESAIPELTSLEFGLMHVFLQHTSASLAINENADRDVRLDLEMALGRIAPESYPYRHTIEGPDDMPAHVKAALVGVELTIPVRNGQLALGVWQGIYLCEHRNHAGPRTLVITVQGQRRQPGG